MAVQYLVLNPRGIPAGIRIMEFQGQEWFEGDAFTRPSAMSDKGFQRLLDGGYITSDA